MESEARQALNEILDLTDLEITCRTDYDPLKIKIHSRLEYRIRRQLNEPGLIRWIEGFPVGSVFYDVGANIGNYAMIAAFRGHTVVAFEPSALNYSALVENMNLNKLQFYVLPVALGRENGLNDLHYRTFTSGEGNVVQGNPAIADNAFVPVMTHSFFRFSLDSLLDLFMLPRPTHIKIDVEGTELDVLMGAYDILETIQGVMVEIDHDQDKEIGILSFLRSRGFDVDFVSRDYERMSNWFFKRC